MKEKIVEILCSINEEIASYKGESMMADGLIDSFEMIRIVDKLENEFDIDINVDDVIVENFGNMDKIIKYLTKLIQE